jgi:hypothetical protein
MSFSLTVGYQGGMLSFKRQGTANGFASEVLTPIIPGRGKYQRSRPSAARKEFDYLQDTA